MQTFRIDIARLCSCVDIGVCRREERQSSPQKIAQFENVW